MTGVFISYSRRDKDFVGQLHEALSARKYDVWVDWQDIPPSTEWLEEIRGGIDQADAFIYLISPESVGSDVCRRELGHAVEQHKRIIPVVRRDPDGAIVPETAATLNWIFLRAADDFDAGVEQLVAAIDQDIERVRTHTRIGVAANRWETAGRESSQLLRGSELNAAESWLVASAGKGLEATQLQRRYVLASRQAATRRQRIVIGGVTVALVVAVVLAVVALIQRSDAVHEKNVAFARQLDANAQSQYSKDPELSVLLAVRPESIQAPQPRRPCAKPSRNRTSASGTRSMLPSAETLCGAPTGVGCSSRARDQEGGHGSTTPGTTPRRSRWRNRRRRPARARGTRAAIASWSGAGCRRCTTR